MQLVLPAAAVWWYGDQRDREGGHGCAMCRSTRLPGDGAVFEMTGKTGSYFYMAPEVANGQPYNEKASMGSTAT